MCPIGKLLSPDAPPPSINKKEATDLLWRSNLPPFQNYYTVVIQYTVEHFLSPFFWEIDRDAAAAGFSLFHLSCVSSYVRGRDTGRMPLLPPLKDDQPKGNPDGKAKGARLNELMPNSLFVCHF